MFMRNQLWFIFFRTIYSIPINLYKHITFIGSNSNTVRWSAYSERIKNNNNPTRMSKNWNLCFVCSCIDPKIIENVHTHVVHIYFHIFYHRFYDFYIVTNIYKNQLIPFLYIFLTKKMQKSNNISNKILLCAK